MTPSQAVDELERQYKQVLDRVVADMFNEFSRITPVGNPSTWKINEGRAGKKLYKPAGYSGGQLKTSWDLTPQGEGWRLSNNMEYASVIFAGRRLVAGKMYGSEQLPAGLDPVLAKYNRILEREFERIRV